MVGCCPHTDCLLHVKVHGPATHGTAIHGTAIHGTVIHGTAIHGTATHGTATHRVPCCYCAPVKAGRDCLLHLASWELL